MKINSLESTIDCLIELNKENRSLHSMSKNQISSVSWLYEFCRVSVDIGRGIGKTHYILSKATKDDLIVVGNTHSLEQYKKQLAKATIIIPTRNTMAFIGNKHNPFYSVYVDEPLMVFSDNTHIYDFLNWICDPAIEQTIIELGKWM